MSYKPRMNAELSPLASLLAREGIAIVPDIYSVNELAEMNSAMTPLFKSQEAQARSYVRPNDMLEIGILDLVFSPGMKNTILSIVPDPVLYHLHAVENAGNQSISHIFGDRLNGWHRDEDSQYFKSDPTHVSIFIYLSHVGADDGPFEFSLQQPQEDLRSGSPVASMTGPRGFSFVWQRGFYHRAAPNRGKRRRRMLKISIQRNAFRSAHLDREFFSEPISKMTHRDSFYDLLFGGYQGKSAPSLKPFGTITPQTVTADSSVDLPEDMCETPVAKPAATRPAAYD